MKSVFKNGQKTWNHALFADNLVGGSSNPPPPPPLNVCPGAPGSPPLKFQIRTHAGAKRRKFSILNPFSLIFGDFRRRAQNFRNFFSNIQWVSKNHSISIKTLKNHDKSMKSCHTTQNHKNHENQSRYDPWAHILSCAELESVHELDVWNFSESETDSDSGSD